MISIVVVQRCWDQRDLAVPQRVPDGERRGQEIFADAAQAHGKLPAGQQEGEQGDRWANTAG